MGGADTAIKTWQNYQWALLLLMCPWASSGSHLETWQAEEEVCPPTAVSAHSCRECCAKSDLQLHVQVRMRALLRGRVRPGSLLGAVGFEGAGGGRLRSPGSGHPLKKAVLTTHSFLTTAPASLACNVLRDGCPLGLWGFRSTCFWIRWSRESWWTGRRDTA